MTTTEVLDLVRKTEALTGEITLDVKEGDLLPETYFYSRDDTRDGLLMRMKEAMDKTLEEAWRKRAAGLPLANRREALTLASIVEKETAVPAERPKVAAVYINRLRRRMKLESDPTTIYGLTQGKVPFNRELTRADLQSNSPYNTYVVTGLPPGPICNPGRAPSSNSSRRRRRARPARRPCRLPASSVRRRDREPCRPLSWPWSSLPSLLSASPGSCAPTRPPWRAGCAWCWSCWAPSPSAAC
jgi:hypothetical protein